MRQERSPDIANSTHFNPEAMPSLYRKLGSRLWHVTLITAVAMGAYGASDYFSDLESSNIPSNTSKTLFKVGFSLMAACWVVLAVLVLSGLRFISAARGLRPLLLACALSTVMLGVRVAYLVFCIADLDSQYGFESTEVAMRVVFGFLPGAICVLVLVVMEIASLKGLEEVKRDRRAMKGSQ